MIFSHPPRGDYITRWSQPASRLSRHGEGISNLLGRAAVIGLSFEEKELLACRRAGR